MPDTSEWGAAAATGAQHCTQATISSIEPKDYPLHRAAFENDVEACRRLLAIGQLDLAKRNVHGDTALHVATMLGHKGECLHLGNKKNPYC